MGKFAGSIIPIVIGSMILSFQSSHAGTQPLSASDQFIEWESKHNPSTNGYGGTYQADEIDIPVMEFRIDHPNLKRVASYMQWVYGASLGPNLVMVDVAPYLPEEVHTTLFFDENGEKWARWPLSPYDTEFKPILEQYLNDLGVPHRIGAIRGRSTSSRSTWNQALHARYEFSTKTSTNATSQGRGSFQYRPYPARWGHLNRKISDYYYSQKDRLRNLEIAWEAAMIALPPVPNSKGKMVDAAMTVRLMDDVARDKVHHMSGFVLNDKAEVARMAKIAGISEQEFLTRCARAFGAALAELHLILGFEVTSAHLQNIRFVLEKNYFPTERMVILDLSDGSPIRPIMEANGGQELLDDWALLAPIGGNPYNKISDLVSTSGDLRWLKPFLGNKEAMNAMAEAMGDRILELTQLSVKEARAMVRKDQRMSIHWGGLTSEFMSKLKPRTRAEVCGEFFR